MTYAITSWRVDATKYLTRVHARRAGLEAVRALGLTEWRVSYLERGSRWYAIVKADEVVGFVKEVSS